MQEHTHTQRLWRKRAQQRLVDEEFQRVRCCLLSLARLRHVADNYYRTALSANVVTALFQCLWRAAKNSRPFVASVINNSRCQLLQKKLHKSQTAKTAKSTAKEQQRTKKESDNQVRAMAKQNEQQAKELSLVQLLSMIDGDDPHNQVIIFRENLNTRMVCS